MTTPHGEAVKNRLTIHVLAAVAEHEAAAISKRTKDALAQKRRFYETRQKSSVLSWRPKGSASGWVARGQTCLQCATTAQKPVQSSEAQKRHTERPRADPAGDRIKNPEGNGGRTDCSGHPDALGRHDVVCGSSEAGQAADSELSNIGQWASLDPLAGLGRSR
jgi:hypothetical protein